MLGYRFKIFIPIFIIFIFFYWYIRSDKIPHFSHGNSYNSLQEHLTYDTSEHLSDDGVHNSGSGKNSNQLYSESSISTIENSKVKIRNRNSVVKKIGEKSKKDDLSATSVEGLPPVFITAKEKLDIAFEKEGFNSYADRIIRKLYEQLGKGSNPDLLSNIVKDIGEMDELNLEEQKQLKNIIVNTLWPE